MARMYSGAKGKAGSKKPLKKTVPSWLRYTAKEIELLIIKLSKENKSPSQIGLHLRDVYGIPDVKVILKTSITHFLKDKGISKKIPEDLASLIKKSIKIRKHLEENKKDETANRGLLLTESKIGRLIRYYKTKKVLPANWKYERSTAGMYVE